MQHPDISTKWKNLYVVYCVDSDQGSTLRSSLLAGHLKYVEANIERYLVAGPLLTAVSGDQRGSQFIVRADNTGDLETFMRGDPYYDSDLYASVQIDRFIPAAGSAIGGISW